MTAGSRRPGHAVVLLLCALGCATPGPAVDTADWLELRTPAFSLYGNLEEAELRELAGELSLFDALVRLVTNTRIGESRLPARFYVLRDGAQARQFMPRYAAGVIYPTLDGYRSILGGDGSPFWTRQVLLHEYTHYVLRGDRRTPIPRWYDEGMCEFLAYTGIREDVVELGRTASMRLQEVDRFGVEPLDELFEPEGKRVRSFYGTAWALVHHLNTSKALNAQSLDYVRRLVQGEAWQEAFDASFDLSVEELEESLAEHIAFLRRGGRRAYLLPLDRVEVPDDPVVTRVEPAEIAYQLGELTRRIADRDAEPKQIAWAGALFRRAVELDPGHLRARAAQAWTLAMQGRFEQADLALAAGDSAASDDPTVALDVARVAVLRASASDDGAAASIDARALLERAIALDPEAPGAHAELGRFLATAGEDEPAVAELERARERGAWSPRLDLDLARLYAGHGERDRARALLRPVAADEHAGEIGEEARRLLGELDAR